MPRNPGRVKPPAGAGARTRKAQQPGAASAEDAAASPKFDVANVFEEFFYDPSSRAGASSAPAKKQKERQQHGPPQHERRPQEPREQVFPFSRRIGASRRTDSAPSFAAAARNILQKRDGPPSEIDEVSDDDEGANLGGEHSTDHLFGERRESDERVPRVPSNASDLPPQLEPIGAGAVAAENQHARPQIGPAKSKPPTLEHPVVAWLHGLGLAGYIGPFFHHGFDTMAACALVEEGDFALLGITPVGHRRVLLDAALKLRRQLAGADTGVGTRGKARGKKVAPAALGAAAAADEAGRRASHDTAIAAPPIERQNNVANAHHDGDCFARPTAVLFTSCTNDFNSASPQRNRSAFHQLDTRATTCLAEELSKGRGHSASDDLSPVDIALGGEAFSSDQAAWQQREKQSRQMRAKQEKLRENLQQILVRVDDDVELARQQLQAKCDEAAREMSRWVRNRRNQAITQAREVFADARANGVAIESLSQAAIAVPPSSSPTDGAFGVSPQFELLQQQQRQQSLAGQTNNNVHDSVSFRGLDEKQISEDVSVTNFLRSCDERWAVFLNDAEQQQKVQQMQTSEARNCSSTPLPLSFNTTPAAVIATQTRDLVRVLVQVVDLAPPRNNASSIAGNITNASQRSLAAKSTQGPSQPNQPPSAVQQNAAPAVLSFEKGEPAAVLPLTQRESRNTITAVREDEVCEQPQPCENEAALASIQNEGPHRESSPDERSESDEFCSVQSIRSDDDAVIDNQPSRPQRRAAHVGECDDHASGNVAVVSTMPPLRHYLNEDEDGMEAQPRETRRPSQAVNLTAISSVTFVASRSESPSSCASSSSSSSSSGCSFSMFSDEEQEEENDDDNGNRDEIAAPTAGVRDFASPLGRSRPALLAPDENAVKLSSITASGARSGEHRRTSPLQEFDASTSNHRVQRRTNDSHDDGGVNFCGNTNQNYMATTTFAMSQNVLFIDVDDLESSASDGDEEALSQRVVQLNDVEEVMAFDDQPPNAAENGSQQPSARASQNSGGVASAGRQLRFSVALSALSTERYSTDAERRTAVLSNEDPAANSQMTSSNNKIVNNSANNVNSTRQTLSQNKNASQCHSDAASILITSTPQNDYAVFCDELLFNVRRSASESAQKSFASRRSQQQPVQGALLELTSQAVRASACSSGEGATAASNGRVSVSAYDAFGLAALPVLAPYPTDQLDDLLALVDSRPIGEIARSAMQARRLAEAQQGAQTEPPSKKGEARRVARRRQRESDNVGAVDENGDVQRAPKADMLQPPREPHGAEQPAHSQGGSAVAAADSLSRTVLIGIRRSQLQTMELKRLLVLSRAVGIANPLSIPLHFRRFDSLAALSRKIDAIQQMQSVADNDDGFAHVFDLTPSEEQLLSDLVRSKISTLLARHKFEAMCRGMQSEIARLCNPESEVALTLKLIQAILRRDNPGLVADDALTSNNHDGGEPAEQGTKNKRGKHRHASHAAKQQLKTLYAKLSAMQKQELRKTLKTHHDANKARLVVQCSAQSSLLHYQAESGRFLTALGADVAAPRKDASGSSNVTWTPFERWLLRDEPDIDHLHRIVDHVCSESLRCATERQREVEAAARATRGKSKSRAKKSAEIDFTYLEANDTAQSEIGTRRKDKAPKRTAASVISRGFLRTVLGASAVHYIGGHGPAFREVDTTRGSQQPVSAASQQRRQDQRAQEAVDARVRQQLRADAASAMIARAQDVDELLEAVGESNAEGGYIDNSGSQTVGSQNVLSPHTSQCERPKLSQTPVEVLQKRATQFAIRNRFQSYG